MRTTTSRRARSTALTGGGRRWGSGVVAIATLALALGACASQPTGPGGGPDEDPATAATGELRVMAAASLAAVFDELAALYVAENPGAEAPVITYDGSSTLVTQLIEGAEAEVFASADQANMAKAVEAGLVQGAPAVFATNVLQIAVAPGNPAGIESLADLADPALQVVLCAPEVPCGAASATAFAAAGVSVAPASEEQNVTAVLTKVVLGEADAGLVYATDVLVTHGGVDGVAFEEQATAVNRYVIGELDRASSPDARAFVDLVLSPAGQRVLAAHGFGPA
ncbi:molybdate ABC transporter substrate-binding protein [Cellulomonas chengniuliangii]|uniref:Molybdate ABC transporter substrate-binding protein n=1 Tax=Cellulomonas chengniuliangii TaxID=2968084 RepID=A0ABY5KX92_9CELL|nr:molybdate ABC transporter substrate-binding protein [Cellulomonas chengniuliangii]MCC2308518.1 molybdate ABC transporter substrate-binding protein [Cellulomonas chengniuliangii]UUI73882.1 molybdate ABC transporter substrate-binding protein [Cellulomonas chengniuliangii]